MFAFRRMHRPRDDDGFGLRLSGVVFVRWPRGLVGHPFFSLMPESYVSVASYDTICLWVSADIRRLGMVKRAKFKAIGTVSNA